MRARELLKKALELDRKYARAWTVLAWTHWNDARFGWSPSRAKSFQNSVETAHKSLALRPDLPGVHALLGGLHLLRREHDKAIAAGRKAVELAPSVADYYAFLAISTYYAGDFAKTVALTKEAMRRHPHYPSWYNYRIGVAYMMLGRYEEAVAALKAFQAGNPSDPFRKPALAATYSMMGRVDDARTLVSDVLAANPSYNLKQYAKLHFFKNPKNLERMLAALRKAGLPE